ncbi:hypothetical protein HDU98_006766 [Podochytrium sp. JEL0797]|nr:hypothetical protein HDU98_006766 [Podochytrium sp. JEL0797]
MLVQVFAARQPHETGTEGDILLDREIRPKSVSSDALFRRISDRDRPFTIESQGTHSIEGLLLLDPTNADFKHLQSVGISATFLGTTHTQVGKLVKANSTFQRSRSVILLPENSISLDLSKPIPFFVPIDSEQSMPVSFRTKSVTIAYTITFKIDIRTEKGLVRRESVIPVTVASWNAQPPVGHAHDVEPIPEQVESRRPKYVSNLTYDFTTEFDQRYMSATTGRYIPLDLRIPKEQDLLESGSGLPVYSENAANIHSTPLSQSPGANLTSPPTSPSAKPSVLTRTMGLFNAYVTTPTPLTPPPAIPRVPRYRIALPCTVTGPGNRIPVDVLIHSVPAGHKLKRIEMRLVAVTTCMLGKTGIHEGDRVLKDVEKVELGGSVSDVWVAREDEGIMNDGKAFDKRVWFQIPSVEVLGQFGVGFEVPLVKMEHVVAFKLVTSEKTRSAFELVPGKEEERTFVLGSVSLLLLR